MQRKVRKPSCEIKSGKLNDTQEILSIVRWSDMGLQVAGNDRRTHVCKVTVKLGHSYHIIAFYAKFVQLVGRGFCTPVTSVRDRHLAFICWISSVDRAAVPYSAGRRFDSCIQHQDDSSSIILRPLRQTANGVVHSGRQPRCVTLCGEPSKPGKTNSGHIRVNEFVTQMQTIKARSGMGSSLLYANQKKIILKE